MVWLRWCTRTTLSGSQVMSSGRVAGTCTSTWETTRSTGPLPRPPAAPEEEEGGGVVIPWLRLGSPHQLAPHRELTISD